jgi:Fic family protein
MLINFIPLLEAKDSSEIENIVTTTGQLFKFSQQSDSADPTTREALRYGTALHQGFSQLSTNYCVPPQQLKCTTTAIEVCSTLKNVDMHIRTLPGNVIGNQFTAKIIYTPPVGETVIRDLLANRERFLHANDDIDPLIKMIVSHYQFESIQPFYDDNGLTGRILNVLYLIEQQLLTLPILYLSRYIVQNK